MRRRLIRAALVAITVLCASTVALDLAELALTGTVAIAPHRIVRLEVSTVVASVFTTWFLGWRA